MNKADFIDVKASNECTLTLQRYENLSNNSFKIICSHANARYNYKQYQDAVARLFDNKFRVVSGTVKLHNSNYNPHVEMIIEANTISKSYNEENTKGLKSVTANVFLSESDNNIWKKVGDGENARLVLTSADNLEEILKARRNKNITTASAMIPEVNAQVGDFVYFYNPSAGCMQFGVKSGEDTVIERNSCTNYKVDAAQISEALYNEELSNNVVAAVNSQNLNKFIGYMRELFSAHPDFFNRWEALIKQRGSEGIDGQFESTQAE